MNDTLCSTTKAYSDEMCHSSQDTLVVVSTEVNNNSNSIDGTHNSVSSKRDTNDSKVKDILDSLSQDSLDGECTDKESTNSNVGVDVDINSNININIVGRGKKLQEVVTKAIEAQNDWDTQFNLDVFVYSALVKKLNVLCAISIDKRLVPPHIYFHPQIFDPAEGFYGKGWKDLLQHLERESFSQGFSVRSQGYGKAGKDKYRRVGCQHGVVYRNSISRRRSVDNYRETRICNDRLNSRGPKGVTMPCRTRTCRSTQSNACCPFNFHIAFDSVGFYIRNCYGCSNHAGHPRIEQDNYHYPACLLLDEEKLIAKTVIDADANKSIVRNAIGRRTGQTVSLSACHYLGTLSNDLKRINSLEELSSPDRIIDFFQNHKYDYIVLYSSTFPQYKSEIVDLVNDNYNNNKKKLFYVEITDTYKVEAV